MEDREIVELYFNRDQRAISETQIKYGRLCHKLINRIVCDELETEECVNDTYLGLWQAIPPQRPENFMAFVARIARNLAVMRLKYLKASKRNSDAIVSLSELEEIIPSADSFEAIEDGDVGRWINEFLHAEDEIPRKIFIRKYWYLDSVADIADSFGFSETKVKSMLFRTRNKLREHLTQKGVEL